MATAAQRTNSDGQVPAGVNPIGHPSYSRAVIGFTSLFLLSFMARNVLGRYGPYFLMFVSSLGFVWSLKKYSQGEKKPFVDLIMKDISSICGRARRNEATALDLQRVSVGMPTNPVSTSLKPDNIESPIASPWGASYWWNMDK